jgi:hypothetical protein
MVPLPENGEDWVAPHALRPLEHIHELVRLPLTDGSNTSLSGRRPGCAAPALADEAEARGGEVGLDHGGVDAVGGLGGAEPEPSGAAWSMITKRPPA